MSSELSRRSFLKLLSILPLAHYVPALDFPFQNLSASAAGQKKNILVLVFDAWSAYHLPFLGYPRNTTPHLNTLLDKSVVYHDHISAGNYTTPGTASLLTSSYSWTHRAFNHDVPANQVISNNIFNAFGSQYHRIGYSHNSLAAHIIHSFLDDLETYIPTQDLYLTNQWVDQLFPNDNDISFLSNFIAFEQETNWNSLFLSEIYKLLIYRTREAAAAQIADKFPEGPPYITRNNYYILEDGIDWLINNLNNLPQPFVAYFHFLPPHQPYNTRKEFLGMFAEDNKAFLTKGDHILSEHDGEEKTLNRRAEYDEYIPYVDAEFFRLFTFLQASGLAENTRLALTSDHGEMFERGQIGHTTKLLSNPVVRVPLVLFDPDFTGRQDITTRTSSLDVLPTLLHLNGEPLPDWLEGQVLPPFSTDAGSSERQIFTIQAKGTPKYGPIETGSIAMYQGTYKLIYYFGYKDLKGEDLYELYKIDEDPEELEDLYLSQPSVARQMVDALHAKLNEVNLPYST